MIDWMKRLMLFILSPLKFHERPFLVFSSTRNMLLMSLIINTFLLMWEYELNSKKIEFES